MVITICGSMDFADRMLEIAADLQGMGHIVYCPEGIEYLRPSDSPFRSKAVVKRQNELIKKHYKKIEDSDAILVLNFDKEGRTGWIGANTFLEIGFAHVLDKGIYMLNPLPDNTYIMDEILSMDLKQLQGSLDGIDEGP